MTKEDGEKEPDDNWTRNGKRLFSRSIKYTNYAPLAIVTVATAAAAVIIAISKDDTVR